MKQPHALANVEDDEIIEAMALSMWEMLESGTTHFIDYREGWTTYMMKLMPSKTYF